MLELGWEDDMTEHTDNYDTNEEWAMDFDPEQHWAAREACEKAEAEEHDLDELEQEAMDAKAEYEAEMWAENAWLRAAEAGHPADYNPVEEDRERMLEWHYELARQAARDRDADAAYDESLRNRETEAERAYHREQRGWDPNDR